MGYAEQTIFIRSNPPLTPAEQAEADSYSSHGVVGSTSARYSYHFGGGFKYSVDELIIATFDAGLWEDSAGSSELTFRFPREALPLETVRPYCLEGTRHRMSAQRRGKWVLVTFRYDEEEGGDWLEESDAPLRELMPLRQAILGGDLTALYLLAYAARQEPEEPNFDFDVEEPYLSALPTPDYLNTQSGALHAFCTRFGIYQDVVEAAVAEVGEGRTPSVDYEALLKKLSKQELREYLLKFLEEESTTAAVLRRRLRELEG